MMDVQREIPCVVMRGGTSKAVFFHERDLPPAGLMRDDALRQVMGSPDRRQIDGLGGADPTTSKVAIIGPSSVEGCDVDYTFVQVGVDPGFVSYAGNCGNVSAAVGVFAIEESLVAPVEPVARVAVFNTNTQKRLVVHVPTAGGRPRYYGDLRIAGVPGTGAEIRLDFAATVGATTGQLLPTGNLRDVFELAERCGPRRFEVSIVDVAKATIFVRAAELGLTGIEGPDDFPSEVLDRCWRLRLAAAERIGVDPGDSHLPTPVVVSAPQPYRTFTTGETVEAAEVSFGARRVIGPPARVHKAFAGTGGVCTAVAAALPGTVLNELAVLAGDQVRIGHPSGVMPVIVRLQGDDVLEASLSRTARRIMYGRVLIRPEVAE